VYQQKLDEARALLSNHFAILAPEPEYAKANSEKVEGFFNKIQLAGGTDDETLKLCMWEDLESFGAPRLIAKRIATIFRKTPEVEEKVKSHKPNKVAGMSRIELVTFYDPNEPGAIHERLEKISGGKKFIVFKDGSVHVQGSVHLLGELVEGYPERKIYTIAGHPYQTYKVGEKTVQLANENPLYPGRLLRPDGTCDQTNRCWEGVEYRMRVILYLAVTQTKEIKIASLSDAHNIMDLAVGSTNPAIRFPEATMLFDRLTEEDRLPKLKLPLKTPRADKPNDPFGHKSY
jgi:hypothetical protein